MSILKLSTILCTFLILQAQALPQNQALNKAATDVNVNNAIIDIISGIVGDVESVVDKILKHLSEGLDKFVEHPHLSLHKRIVEVLEKILDHSLTVVDKHLNKLAEDGNADTKVLVGCIQNEKDNLKTLVNGTFDKNSQCLVEELVTLHKSLQPIVGDLQKVQSDVKESLAKLDTCSGDGVDAIECAVGVAKDALEVAKEIPEVTKEDVKNLIEVVKAFPQSFKTCIKSNADDFRGKIVELIDNISTCTRK